MALIGLGLLGGIGALVDYWPAPADAPAVASADVPMPAVAEAYLAVDAMMPDFAARQRASAPMARAVPVAPALPTLDALPVTHTSTEAPIAAATQVALHQPPSPPLLDTAEIAPLTGLPFADVMLVTEVLAADTSAFATESSAPSADETGFLADATDVLKKTGSTVVNGTMKAGVPFVSVARFLGGAFRKITPFKN